MRRIVLALLAAVLAAPAAFAQSASYRIQPGDQLAVTVLEDDTLNRQVLVLPDGRISVPLAGTIQASGRTVDSVEGTIADRLASNFAVRPSVFVSVTGISDTGTTLILMGDSAVDTYYASVSGAKYNSQQGGYVFPCSAKLPTLSIRIGPTNYATIPASLLNFGSAGGSSCFGSLQSVGGGSQNIYGDVFFNAYYGIFDARGPRFGFAPIA